MATDSAELDWRKDGELEIHTEYVLNTKYFYTAVYILTLIQRADIKPPIEFI